jgi:hypothetical protein
MKECKQKLTSIFDLVDLKKSSTLLIQYFYNKNWCQISKNKQSPKFIFLLWGQVYLLILPALAWSGRNLGCHPYCTHSLTGLHFVTVSPRSQRRFPWAVPLGLGTQMASAMSLAPPVHALLTLQTPSPPFPSCRATCILPCSLSPLLSQKPPWHSPTHTQVIVDSRVQYDHE